MSFSRRDGVNDPFGTPFRAVGINSGSDTCMICLANHTHTCPGIWCQGVQVRIPEALSPEGSKLQETLRFTQGDKILDVRLTKAGATIQYGLQTDDFLRLHLTVVLCRPGCGREV